MCVQLARENGIQHTLVVRNGQMVGVGDRRNRAEYGAPASLSVVGKAALTTFYNDGDKVGGAVSGAWHRTPPPGHLLAERPCPRASLPLSPSATSDGGHPPTHTQERNRSDRLQLIVNP